MHLKGTVAAKPEAEESSEESSGELSRSHVLTELKREWGLARVLKATAGRDLRVTESCLDSILGAMRNH